MFLMRTRTVEMYQTIENNVLKMFNGVKYHHERTKFKIIMLFNVVTVGYVKTKISFWFETYFKCLFDMNQL